MGNKTRQQALWKSRNRAFRTLADKHSEEFREIRDAELLRLGQPPIAEFENGQKVLEQGGSG